MKKKLLILLMGLSMVFAQLLVAPMAIAEGGNAGGNSGGDSGNNSGGTGFGNATCPETHFMGLRAWYDGELLNKVVCGGEQPANEGEIRQLVWMIVLNIATMVLQIAGYVCVGFVIWGGYQYMLARGDSGKVANGKKTITNALIGIVICVTASLISGAIVDIASGAANDANFFAEIFNHAFMWAGIVCAIVMVIGGISYVTSVGDSGKVQKAKSTIMYAAIGLVITLLAAAIVNLVVSAVNGG